MGDVRILGANLYYSGEDMFPVAKFSYGLVMAFSHSRHSFACVSLDNDMSYTPDGCLLHRVTRLSGSFVSGAFNILWAGWL